MRRRTLLLSTIPAALLALTGCGARSGQSADHAQPFLGSAPRPFDAVREKGSGTTSAPAGSSSSGATAAPTESAPRSSASTTPEVIHNQVTMVKRTFPEVGGLSLSVPNTWQESPVERERELTARRFADASTGIVTGDLQIIGPLSANIDIESSLRDLVDNEAQLAEVTDHAIKESTTLDPIRGGGPRNYAIETTLNIGGQPAGSIFLMLQNGTTSEIVSLRFTALSGSAAEALIHHMLSTMEFV